MSPKVKKWKKALQKHGLPYRKESKQYRLYCLGKTSLNLAIQAYKQACERHEADYDKIWAENYNKRKQHALELVKRDKAKSFKSAMRQVNYIHKFYVREQHDSVSN